MNKTAEEILREKIENELGDLSSDDNFLRLIHFPNVAVLAAMEEYAAQFAAPPPASEGVLTGEDYRNLIDTHIGRMGELEKGSIKHFIETGTINGSFNLRLVSLINFAISLAKGKAALATLPTREPAGEIITQNQIDSFIADMMEKDPMKFVKYCLIVIGRDLQKSGAGEFKFSVGADLLDDKRFKIDFTGTIEEIESKTDND